jgi:predicted component of type VI protein secretion system
MMLSKAADRNTAAVLADHVNQALAHRTFRARMAGVEDIGGVTDAGQHAFVTDFTQTLQVTR